MRHNLRWRIAVGMALLTVAVVSVHSLLLFTASDRLEEDLIDRITTEELKYFITKYRSDAVAPPASENLKGYVVRDEAERSRLPEYLRALSTGLQEVIVEGEESHVAVRDEPEGRFIMVYDAGHHEARERGFILVLLVGSGLAALGAAVISYWVAGLLVRPVRRLAERVETLGPDRPAAPLARDFAEEEVRRLARAFDRYLDKVSDFIEREQDFTANISHELRNPLTAIRTSCELLLQEPGLPDRTRLRIEAIDRAAGRLAETTRSLLFLARGGKPARLEDVSILECVEEAGESVRASLARRNIRLEMAVDAGAVVRADRAALFLVIDNLLRNAALYTERGQVRVGFHDECLTIEDTGRGIHASELPRVVERYYRGAHPETDGNLGLGLAIVHRICERFGWRLEITSRPGVGTRVAVHFPVSSSQDLHADLTPP
jgi:signal transduction histidine kinase